MPWVTIKTGIVAADGQEEVLTEYQCDWPDCANVAEHVLGVVRDATMACAVCPEHARGANVERPVSRPTDRRRAGR